MAPGAQGHHYYFTLLAGFAAVGIAITLATLLRLRNRPQVV